MAFWSGEKLKSVLKSKNLITDFDDGRVDCAAYTLRMGCQYYITASEQTVDTNTIQQLKEGDCLAIPSGQFAVLLTEETITVPSDAIAFISIKNGLKSRGLVNVSGFHVDPGYSAPLRFAVFNAGPSTICIKRGEDSFLIWYADLDQDDRRHIKTESQNKTYSKGISSGDVSTIAGAVKTISVLSSKVDSLEKTQNWMRPVLSAFGLLTPFIIGLILFFVYEGVRSFLTKAAPASPPTSVISSPNAPPPERLPGTKAPN
jgi:dCTP deaminase